MARVIGRLFLVPIAVLIETGNHIAQVTNGNARRDAASTFVSFARLALEGNSPFTPTPLPTGTQVQAWLEDFPNDAMRQVGIADRSFAT